MTAFTSLFLGTERKWKTPETKTSVRNERLAFIVERCLESQAAYKLFDMLASISDLSRMPRWSTWGW